MDQFLKPLTALAPAAVWPPTLAGGGAGVSLFERVFFTDFRLIPGQQSLGASLTLVLLGELAVGVPGVEGLTFVLAPGQVSGTSAFSCLFSWAADRFDVTIEQLKVALRFPPEVLAPVSPRPGKPAPAAAQIEMQGTIVVDQSFDISVFGFNALTLPPAMIGRTGLIVEAEGLTLDLSRTYSPQEILDAGFDDAFIGVFVRKAKLRLPPGMSVVLPGDIVLENCAVGTEGFAGRVTADWTPVLNANGNGYSGDGAGTLFGLPFALKRFALDFKQNTIVASDIRAELILPFFDHPVAVDLALGLNGDFTVGLSAVQPVGTSRTANGLIEFTKPGLLTLKVASLSFEKRGDDFLVKLSGSIKLLYGGFDWPEVEVQELSIDKNGHVHIDGGWLDLPKSASFGFDGFPMELTKIGFGNTDDGRKWVGFSGRISLVEDLSFGASVDGLKILWDSSGHVDLQLSDIKVDLTIPDVLSFNGFVQYFHDGSTKGFKGDVKLVLDTPEIAFDAQLMVGRNTQAPPYNFFYVVVDAELPVGIPLGQTNVAIYGFAGLFGDSVTPKKDANTEWYQWYSTPTMGATSVAKWTDARGSLALGAGLTLGTAADDGFALSARTVLILLLPGPLLLIDGKANMLKDRSELSGNKEGTYQALAVLDGRAGTFLINIQPHFQYDQVTKAMLDVTGVAEGFFDFNHPDAWHIYLGQEPPPKRIRGTVEKLLKADAYLMLDHSGMRLGASTGIDKHYDYGALAVALKAIIEGEATVSWRPTQLDGKLIIDGLAALRAFGCSASASVDAALAVQTPHPFHVVGDVNVSLSMPWPLPDPSADIHFEWGDADGPAEEPPASVASLAGEHLKVTESWRLPTDAAEPSPPLVAGGGEPPARLSVMPLDAKLLISFSRPVVDRALIGSNGGPAPHPERVGGFEISHELLAVELAKRDGRLWTVVTSRQGGAGDLFGMWLPLPEGDQAAGKLELWNRSPFAYTRNSGRSYVDWFTEQNPAYPCFSDEPPESVCADFDAVRGRVLPPLFIVGDFVFEFLFTNPLMEPQLVNYASALTDTKRALQLSYLVSIPLRITPLEPASAVSCFVSHSQSKIALTLRAFRGGQVVATATSQATGDTELAVKARGIEYVELGAKGPAGPQPVLVLRVCATLQAEQDRADQLSLLRGRLQTQLAPGASWCGEDHLLDADSVYRLKVTTQIRKWQNGQELDPTTHDNVVYFRTTGPPGFLETEGRLRDLSAYVDPASSVPHNGARPVYRGYDLRVVFNANYMERLYKGTGHDLSIALVDQNGQLAQSVAGAAVPVVTEWDRDPYGALAVSDQLWMWAIGRPGVTSAGCRPSVGGDCVVKRSSLEARLRDAPLSPQALIEARIAAAGHPPLHRLSFTTSRFVTFIHHVQSFGGEASDYPLSATAAMALTPDELTRLHDIVQTRRQAGPAFDPMSEPPAFDELRASLFKLGHRPTPNQVRTTLLHDGAHRYALLLESPEPLDWARTSLTVRRSAAAAPEGMPARGPIKIIDAALAPSATSGAADYNAEWIELLVQTDANVSGCSIEHSGSLQEPTAFTTYYRFGDETSMPAGTLIRIHSGSQAADAAPVPERVHRYVMAPGQNGSWRLNAAGDVIRFLDASSREVQRWSVLPGGTFLDLGIVTIRNADQTSAFLFFPQLTDVPVGNIPDGRFRMAWSFKRDIGEQAPVLRRWGMSGSEDTVTEFHLPPRS